MTARDKRVHRMALNAIGTVCFQEQRFEESRRFFETVMELDGLQNDTPYFANLIDASMRAGKYREGLEALNRHADYVETRPALQADRAFLQGQLGDANAYAFTHLDCRGRVARIAVGEC